MSEVENPNVSTAAEGNDASNRLILLLANGLAWLLVSVGSYFLQAWVMPLHGDYEAEGLNIAGYLFPFMLPVMSAILGIAFNFAIARTHKESQRVALSAVSLFLALLVTLVAFSILTFPLVSLMYSLR